MPAIFQLIQKLGDIPTEEMDQVFNMGIGMVLIVSAKQAEEALRLTRGIRIGEITDGPQDVVIS